MDMEFDHSWWFCYFCRFKVVTSKQKANADLIILHITMKIIFIPWYINITLIQCGISHINVNLKLIMQFKETVTPVLAAYRRPSLSAAAISPSRHRMHVMTSHKRYLSTSDNSNKKKEVQHERKRGIVCEVTWLSLKTIQQRVKAAAAEETITLRPFGTIPSLSLTRTTNCQVLSQG